MYRSIIYIIKPVLSIFIFGIFISVCYAIFPKSFILAQSSLNALQSEAQALQNDISNVQQQINNNSSNISSLSGKIQTYQALIVQKESLIYNYQSQINQINGEISSLGNQIQNKYNKINMIKGEINSNALSDYEQSYVPPATLFLGNPDINSSLTSVAYFNSSINTEKNLANKLKGVITSLQNDQTDLNLKKQDVTSIQGQVEAQNQSLQNDQSSLQSEESVYVSQNNSLNSQKIQYQNQYQGILSQINSLYSATFTGQGCIPGNSWYYCQQWYGTLAGMYGTSIDMTYGCLLTDIAMVATDEVSSIYTPPVIASMTYFTNDYMDAWPDIPGTYPEYMGYGKSGVDNALAQGYPAIVYLAAPAGQHWVVIYQSLSNGDYLINDPWYGSALTFLGSGNGTHEYYNFSEIGAVYILAKG